MWRYLLILAVFLLSGCMRMMSVSSPPEYYQLDYAFEPQRCVKPFSGAVRVWSFSASAPYDREQMVAIAPTQKVRFSSTHKWVSPPGNMVADKLMRDLSLGTVFENAVPVGNPMPAEYELSGQIYRFALEENGSPHRAVLDLEVSLWREKPIRIVLFRKHYHYQSAPLGESDPKEFSKAISSLVSQLSVDLRNALCDIKPDSSHPADG